jgi:hypothetical protein
VEENSSIIDRHVKIIDPSPHASQEKGEILEKAVLELFHQFFIIAEEDEDTILQKLRQQKKGLQFGHDISFECAVKENKNLKCHIECKNIRPGITLKDIADKLISTEVFCPDLDHWILISPHSNPSNELDNLLSRWGKERKYPFDIHIWSPDRGVREFFGLSPTIYDLFYKPEENEIHPSQWCEEKRREVFEKWKEKLKPLTRLPKEWELYMKEPFRMCLKGENSSDLDELYQHYVSMRCMDERRNVINQELKQHVLEWLEDTKTTVMFLLGGFGDGKTAFTYILSRYLAQKFIKDPSTGWIPVRFALRDYHSAGASQEFLRSRFEEFGANIAGWNKLKEQNNLLVVLDGFDEMTKELDSKTITKNIKDLIDCCNEFKALKIIITSRTDFFENQGDKKRLLQRLPPNITCYLAPIDRRTVKKHLEKSASPDDKKKLQIIYNLHDPIELASKPLFLQMIEETLHELPEENLDKNLDEIRLYDTYIDKSLKRKIENLDDDEMRVDPNKICSNLGEILEQIALKLQGSSQNFIPLGEFSSTGGQTLAELLWKISGSDEVLNEPVLEGETVEEEDATARVGIRSLLKQVKTKDDTHKWPVDFCHRSMGEYFVARGIRKALREDIEKAKELLTELPLNHEIIYFTAELMKKDDFGVYERNLLNLLRTTKGSNQSRNPGGNAVTLLFRLKGELPGNDWSGLNLDYANLSGANLSNKNFFGAMPT